MPRWRAYPILLALARKHKKGVVNWRVLVLTSDAQLSLTLNLGCRSCLAWYLLGPRNEGALGLLVLVVWSSRPLAYNYSKGLLYIYKIHQ